jgi:hypothetical protein
MRGAAVALVLAALVLACTQPAALPPVITPPATATPEPTITVLTPTVADPAIGETGCEPGQRPVFAFGFAALRAALGDRMGDPVSCERYGPEGDALQQTSTGLARYRKATNTPTFISGSDHWALTERGLVHWTGGGLDPPDDAAPAVLPPTPIVRLPTLTPVAARGTRGEGDPMWLEHAMALIQDYDRKHGSSLSTALDRVRIVVLRQNGAWAAFVPSARTITLDPVLQTEIPEAVATVLAHEAQHAVDQVLNGGPRTEVACLSYEISAFRLQAAVWQSFFGPAGKPDPQTQLEDELNEIVHSAQSNAGRLVNAIQTRYADQCA